MFGSEYEDRSESNPSLIPFPSVATFNSEYGNRSQSNRSPINLSQDVHPQLVGSPLVPDTSRLEVGSFFSGKKPTDQVMYCGEKIRRSAALLRWQTEEKQGKKAATDIKKREALSPPTE